MSEGPSDPNVGALINFLDGVQEKMDTNFGRITSLKDEREVKREIARELRVEDDYTQERWPPIDESDDASEARRKVETRYSELRRKGMIEEVGNLAELKEWSEKISAHLRGEECFWSEDLPHAHWHGDSVEDSSDGD